MNDPPSKPTRLPIALSAFVCPGAGQCMQGRWVIGATTLLAFCFFLIVLLKNIVVPMAHNLKVALDMQGDFREISPRSILVPFAFAMAIYTAGLCDVYAGYLRQLRAWREESAGRSVSETS